MHFYPSPSEYSAFSAPWVSCDATRAVMSHLEGWVHGGNGAAILAGPQDSGKSHLLAHLCNEQHVRVQWQRFHRWEEAREFLGTPTQTVLEISLELLPGDLPDTVPVFDLPQTSYARARGIVDQILQPLQLPKEDAALDRLAATASEGLTVLVGACLKVDTMARLTKTRVDDVLVAEALWEYDATLL